MKKDKLEIKIYDTRDEMGKGASEDIARAIKAVIAKRGEANIIFAAAPSQNDMLYHLTARDDVEWEKINAYHMDEYIGLDPDAPQCFSNFLKERIFDLKPFKSVNLINPGATADSEAKRYSDLLNTNKPDIICMGIGENGHIAFNDPHVADFMDPKTVKEVTLDEVCRMQQVNDGCFKALSDVPKSALTVTIPMLASPEYIFCVVPAKTKACAVKNTVLGEIGEWCPATVLRIKAGAILYCDNDSSVYIKDRF